MSATRSAISSATGARGGYDNLGDLRKLVGELEPDELFEDDRSPRGSSAPSRARSSTTMSPRWPATRRRAQEDDNDRLDAAFEALEDDHAVLARQDYWCCQTCGSSAIATR